MYNRKLSEVWQMIMELDEMDLGKLIERMHALEANYKKEKEKPITLSLSRQNTESSDVIKGRKTSFVPSIGLLLENYEISLYRGVHTVSRSAYSSKPSRILVPDNTKKSGSYAGRKRVHLCVPENNHVTIPMSYVIFALEHRRWPSGIIMESGPKNKGKAIKHIDGNIQNNDPDNLIEANTGSEVQLKLDREFAKNRVS